MTDEEYEILKTARKDEHGMKILLKALEELEEETKKEETERE